MERDIDMSSGKRSILILIGRYLPGESDGGPVRTIRNLVDHLGYEYQFLIMTNDRDSNDNQPYQNITPDTWNIIGETEVYYSSPNRFSINAILKASSRVDLIYCCGIYNIYALKVMLLKKIGYISKPLVIAPMGSLSKGALTFKRFKKYLYINMCVKFGIFNGLKWSVSSEDEKCEVAKINSNNAHIYIARDLSRKNAPVIQNRNKEKGTINIVYISRIVKKKNLLGAIDIVSKLQGDVKFEIYGNQEDKDYWNICEKRLREAPNRIMWEYHGVIKSIDVIDEFAHHDVFLFPTFGENYGHVIIEACTAGCVPIISNKTPWHDLNVCECGNEIELHNISEFVSIIHKYQNMSCEAFTRISKNAQAYSARILTEDLLHTGYRSILDIDE
jgi:glycosyltransferase involved in cell wall biosynthesis